jgi:hypothetical protein
LLDQLDTVARPLGAMLRDDDAELTAEDRRAAAASRVYLRQNQEGGILLDQVVAECGFTMDQVGHHQGE